MPTGTRSLQRKAWVPLLVAAIASAAFVTTFFDVRARTLGASGDPTVGPLRLRLTGTPATFAQPAGGLVPGDALYRDLELVNDGPPRRALTEVVVSLAAATPPTEVRPALRASLLLCERGSWQSGRCSGRVRTLVALPMIKNLPQPVSVDLGLLQTGASAHLRARLELADRDERVVNGRLPPNSLQGRRVTVTWSFRERAGATAGPLRGD